MLWLKPHTARIAELIEQGTPESLTHAALQCRLAIEQVCYERLRNAHNYISHADLGRWQPRDVVQRLIQDVDPHIADTFTMSISKSPAPSVKPQTSIEEFEAEDYVAIGTQVGFDARTLGKLWNSLGSFLHVRVPKNSADATSFFAEPDDIRRRVLAALAELRRLEQGTLISSGAGAQVKFECDCGHTNRRRSALLRNGQVVSCINPDCPASWTAHVENGEFSFERRTVDLPCHACGAVMDFPERTILGLDRLKRMRVLCSSCGAENFFTWVLRHQRRDPPP